ncbi:MAG: hypothetical protein GVY33_10125 [Alphaproteobacteria bacterium]|nr:hypothetical protein [Alphaproteobacteria bacterium]
MRAIPFPLPMPHRRGRPRRRSERNDRDPGGGRAAVAFGYRSTSPAGDAADAAQHADDATEAVEGVAGNVFVRVDLGGGVDEREARWSSKRVVASVWDSAGLARLDGELALGATAERSSGAWSARTACRQILGPVGPLLQAGPSASG